VAKKNIATNARMKIQRNNSCIRGEKDEYSHECTNENTAKQFVHS